MNGLELGESFFRERGMPALAARHADALPHLAAGLVGEGSECFGIDDEHSHDHDWGAGFCLWLPENVYRIEGKAIARTLRGLRADPGIPSRFTRMMGTNDSRVGVFSVDGFYRRFIGFDHPPRTLEEWWALPDANLAVATNGVMFCDNLGEFSAWRKELSEGYPDDARRKKLAYCCYLASQAGQYNYPRMMRRGRRCAALLAQTTFMTAALRIVYYANGAYPPFYKWLQPLVRKLPILGEASFLAAEQIAAPDANADDRWPRTAAAINRWCAGLADAVRESGLVQSAGTDLYALAVELHRGIEEGWLKRIPLEAPC